MCVGGWVGVLGRDLRMSSTIAPIEVRPDDVEMAPPSGARRPLPLYQRPVGWQLVENVVQQSGKRRKTVEKLETRTGPDFFV